MKSVQTNQVVVQSGRQTATSKNRSNTSFIFDVNRLISSFTESRDITALGQSYGLLPFEECEKQLILHRMTKKFEVPNDALADERVHLSIAKMISADEQGIATFQPAKLDLNPYVRHQLYNIRARLHERISDYRFDCTRFQLPSGETFVSSGGDVSAYAKLRDRSQWVTTHRNFDRFAEVCYNSPMLKFAARRHMKMWQVETGRRFAYSKMWQKAKASGLRNPRFVIFKSMLRCIVTFSPFARLTTVPKDNSVDRVIECECFCNMIVQRAIENVVRDLIKTEFNVDLDESQTVHKLLLLDENNVTIDLKNASNSVYMAVVDWFIGDTKLGRDIKNSRSQSVTYVNSNGTKSEHRFTMMSPMGNGFTFGIMTLLLLTICREFDSFAHVFGDDIIVDKDVADDVISLLQVIGFSTNESKTFLSGNFRESCGGFTSEGRFITSFDVTWSIDIVDAMITTNKIGIMANSASYDFGLELLKLHADLIDACPPHLLVAHDFVSDYAARKIFTERHAIMSKYRSANAGCQPFGHLPGVLNAAFYTLAGGVFLPLKRILRLQRKDTRCVDRFNKYKGSGKIRPLCYVNLSFEKRSVTYKNEVDKDLKPVTNVSQLFSWWYLYSNRVIAPTTRDIEVVNRWQCVY